MRYLVKAKLKSGQSKRLLQSINDGTLGKGSIAGDEYIYDMTEAQGESFLERLRAQVEGHAPPCPKN